ncbi:hypothetical protein ACFWJW_04855 [Streptomyces sp. NPDC127097]|uniref:hypothetical protein n=1 Tax=Streptomyces sp. NPDC127097 TaxID=3347136 RepID=UPI003666C072
MPPAGVPVGRRGPGLDRRRLARLRPDAATAAHLTASTGTVTLLLSQLELAGPSAPALMRDFWRCAVEE